MTTLNWSSLDPEQFHTIIDGKEVNLYFLRNKNGMEAYFTNYGGRLVSLLVPNKEGTKTDVVIGLNSAEAYRNSTEPYFGATIGRYANRIAKGRFTLIEECYTIPVINGEHALHGGVSGFNDVVWEATQSVNRTLVLEYFSEDMEQGFPGNLRVKVTFTLTEENELKIEYLATTDKPTVVNLTNHAFFNLNGEGSGSILNHSLEIHADKFTSVDEQLIPTGKLEEVENTPFDFRKDKKMGKEIETNHEQLRYGNGYDHNFVLNGSKAKGMNHAATVTGDKSRIVMDVYTKEPGMQFYSGNFLKGENILKTGNKDDFRTAFALETQHFPDSPNQPSFPSTELRPGEVYATTTIYQFDVAE